jgi:hypothetical protein
MPAYSKATIKKLLRSADTATTADAKGAAFEDLICYLIGKIAGITHIERNPFNAAGSEELDVVVWNEKHPVGLSSLNNIIPIECKNCIKPVSSREVDWFISKIRRPSLDFGVMVAAEGVTGNPDKLTGAHDIVAGAIQEGIRVIVLTRADIASLTTSEQLVKMIQVKICKLVIKRTASP